MQFTKMSSVFLASLLLIATLAGAQAKDKQIKLEDIERDNLAAERHAKSTKPQMAQGHQGPPGYAGYQQLAQQFNYQSLGQASNYYRHQPNGHNLQNHQPNQHNQQISLQAAQGTPSTPRMQFGFVPMKPNQQYYQQQEQQQHQGHQNVQYQYVTPQTHTQAYLPSSGRQPQVNTQRPTQFKSPGVQYAVHQPQQEGSTQGQRYTMTVPIQTQAYQQYLQSQGHHQSHSVGSSAGSSTGHSGEVQYIPESRLQQYYQYQSQQGLYQPSQGHSQSQPTQGHQQIQYVVDNSIQSDSQLQPQDDQKYYQQYVYLQPYQTPSASSNIHSVTDTKGNIQYVMYIQAGATGGAATYPPGTVLAYPTNEETQYVYQPVAEEPQASKETVEVPVSQGHSQSHVSEGTQYVIPQETPVSKLVTSKRFERPVFKHQPTSLLDSYVPSYLQYQYYKQQHDNANAIKQSIKVGSADVGKTDVVKSY